MTRLCPPLEPHESAAFSRCFLQDTAENILAVSLERKNANGVAVVASVSFISEPTTMIRAVQSVEQSRHLPCPQLQEPTR